MPVKTASSFAASILAIKYHLLYPRAWYFDNNLINYEKESCQLSVRNYARLAARSYLNFPANNA
jgi:hypothetical protein